MEFRAMEMKTAVYTSLIGGGVLCAILMAAGFLGLDWILNLIQTPGDVFADCKDYLQIYILSLSFVFGYNVATGILSALGDSQTPFWFLVYRTPEGELSVHVYPKLPK